MAKEPCEGCEDCNCGEEQDEVESETPNLDLMRQLQKMGLPSGVAPAEADDDRRISIDRDNADLYAFSDIDLRQLREGKEADATPPLEWTTEDIQKQAHRIVSKIMDG